MLLTEEDLKDYQIRESNRDSIADTIQASMRNSLWESIYDHMGIAVRHSIQDCIWGSVRDTIHWSVRHSISRGLEDATN